MPVFLGAFLVKIPFFCNFLVLNRHFYHNQRQNYCLLCLAPAFSSLAAAFCNTFHKVFLVPLSTSAQNHEKHQKNAKLGFSHASAIFFAEKHFVGCRYIYNKTLLTCTNDSRRKRCILKIFTDHEPFERRVRSQGVHLHHAFSPHPDQIETRGLDH